MPILILVHTLRFRRRSGLPLFPLISTYVCIPLPPSKAYHTTEKCGREGKSKNGWESEITTFFSLLPISSLDTKQKILKLFKRIKEEDAAHIKAILELLGDTTLINSL